MMAKLSMSNNPVARRKRRYRTLRKRAAVAFRFMRPATVEYDENGAAAALYPNLHPKRRRAQALHRQIRAEMDIIANWLHAHGYTLA